MTTTTGQPERTHWSTEDWSHRTRNPWAVEAIRARGRDDYGMGIVEESDEPEPDPFTHSEELERELGDRSLSPETQAARLEAIRDSLGDPEWTPDVVGTPQPPQPDERAYAAMDAPSGRSADPEPPSEGSRAYVVREGDWRERKGLPRKRKSVPPSRTREGRRAAHIRAKAERLGISYADAERETQRRERSAPSPTPRRRG
jgi:hypothetical protein